MADEAKETNKEETAPAAKAAPAKSAGGLKPKLITAGLAVAVIFVAAIVGSMLSKYIKLPGAKEASGGEVAVKGSLTEKAGSEFTYYDFGPIVVNLDERKMIRYVRVTVILSIRKENWSDAKEILEKKKPELKSWLNVYFAGCTLEDVRGPKNLNRIRQEIAESINDQLWHNSKPLVDEVLFGDIAIQ
ncbi:MAG: flagellar basal body-associated FliL family protein [Planctomycetaceae bacterium]|nr:MAG: flagellar basal body-associated FliL family protein [Planctomycetaceae bacterium]